MKLKKKKPDLFYENLLFGRVACLAFLLVLPFVRSDGVLKYGKALAGFLPTKITFWKCSSST